MNQKQMNPGAPNTLTAGSKTWKLGALALAVALAMTLAPRAWAEHSPEPLSRPQLGGDVAVQSVLRYIALHSNDVAGYQAMDPAVDSVARYIALHTVRAQSVPSAAEQGIIDFLRA